MLGVDDREDAGDRLAEVVAGIAKTISVNRALYFPQNLVAEQFDVHLGELGARRDDLLDAKLAELSLELTELLDEILLALAP